MTIKLLSKTPFFLIAFVLLNQLSYAQVNPLQKSEKNRFEKKMLFSFSGGGLHFFSGNFWTYTLNQPHLITPVESYAPYYTVKYGTPFPNDDFHPTNYSSFMNFSIGLELNKINTDKIKITHIIEASYVGFASNFNYDVLYAIGSSGLPNKEYIDKNQIHNNHSIFSLGYQFQPTFKNIFLSVGVYPSFCHVTSKRLTDESSHEYWYTLQSNGEYYDKHYGPLYSEQIETSIKKNYVNGLLKMGTGYYFYIKQFTLKPGFYFISDLLDGANFYSVTLGVIFKSK